MSIQENKTVVRRVYDAINEKAPEALDALMASDVESHTPFPHAKGGLDGFKEVFAAVTFAFPDYTITIEEQIAEDDRVVTRYLARGTQVGDFLGVAPTGEPIELIGIDIDRLAGGKIVEHWSEAGTADLGVSRGVAVPR
jgi:predicted ester cyclase